MEFIQLFSRESGQLIWEGSEEAFDNWLAWNDICALQDYYIFINNPVDISQLVC